MSRFPDPRPDLAGLTPYRSSDTRTGTVFLHANENPYPPPPAVMDEIVDRVHGAELNRYPAPEATALRAALASYAGIDGEWVWVGDGSNEVLLQACLAYGGAGRTALLFEPTYRMHHRQAAAAGTAVELCRRGTGFAIDPNSAEQEIARLRPDIVFVCTPNNPTGTLTPRADVERIATAAPGLVVVDEAYFEFAGETFVDVLDRHPNVLVVRTLSKAFAMAGIRLGYAIGHPDLLEPFARVRMPYGLSTFTQIAAETVLLHSGEVLRHVKGIIGERERILRGLESAPGTEVFPSAANFVLFRHPHATRLCRDLAERGIVVRDFSTLPGAENCLRVTAGRPEENDAFLDALSELAAQALSSEAPRPEVG